MKKFLIFLIGMVMLTACCGGQSAGAEEATFKTIGDAVNSPEEDRAIGGTEDQYIVVLKNGDGYVRVVADMDDKAKELYEATMMAEDFDKAYDEYLDYVSTLPVAYTEEITAKPLDQEYLDSLIGMTMYDLEDEGFEPETFGTVDAGSKQYKDFMNGDISMGITMGTSYGKNISISVSHAADAAVGGIAGLTMGAGESHGESSSEPFMPEVEFTMSNGLFLYHFFAEQTQEEFMNMEDGDDLVAMTAVFAGISPNAGQLRYHADGEVEQDPDPYVEYAALVEKLQRAVDKAVKKGDLHVNTLIEELVEKYPESEEDVRELVPVLVMFTTGDTESYETHAYD